MHHQPLPHPDLYQIFHVPFFASVFTKHLFIDTIKSSCFIWFVYLNNKM